MQKQLNKLFKEIKKLEEFQQFKKRSLELDGDDWQPNEDYIVSEFIYEKLDGIEYDEFPGCCGAFVLSGLTDVSPKIITIRAKHIGLDNAYVRCYISLTNTQNHRSHRETKWIREFVNLGWVYTGRSRSKRHPGSKKNPNYIYFFYLNT